MITDNATGRIWPDIWAAIEDDAAVAANLRMRSDLMDAIKARIGAWQVSQTEAAKRLGISQPRLNELLRDRFNRFSLDALVRIAATAGIEVTLGFRDAA